MVERDVVTFQPHPDFLVDVSDFERYAAQKNRSSQNLHDLRHGVSLYRGQLLEGVTLEDCPEIDEWLFLERERLGQQAIHVLQLTIDGCLAVNEVDQALGFGPSSPRPGQSQRGRTPLVDADLRGAGRP